MTELLNQLTGDPLTNAAVQGVIALAVLDWVLGTVDAIRRGEFDWAKLSDWVRAHLLEQVLPIILVLAFGRIAGTIQVGDTSLSLLTAAGLAAAATYTATTVASVVAHVRPSSA